MRGKGFRVQENKGAGFRGVRGREAELLVRVRDGRFLVMGNSLFLICGAFRFSLRKVTKIVTLRE